MYGFEGLTKERKLNISKGQIFSRSIRVDDNITELSIFDFHANYILLSLFFGNVVYINSNI